jgi:hypothetical protein
MHNILFPGIWNIPKYYQPLSMHRDDHEEHLILHLLVVAGKQRKI